MQKQPSKKELKTKEMKELKEAGYTYDEIKKYHYIKIQGVYMKLFERTPPINNRITGSLFGKNIENNYENFKRYNIAFSSNCLTDVGIEQAEKSIFFENSILLEWKRLNQLFSRKRSWCIYTHKRRKKSSYRPAKSTTSEIFKTPRNLLQTL